MPLRCARAALVFLASLSESAYARPESSITASSGLLNYTVSSVVEKQGSNFANVGLEWQSLPRLGLGFALGAMLAQDTSVGRLLYQATYLDFRLFPLTPGLDIDKTLRGDRIKVESAVRPWASAGLGVGRMLVSTFGRGAADISSEFVSLRAGAGVDFALTPRLGVVASCIAEYATGFGILTFSSVNVHAKIGLKLFL